MATRSKPSTVTFRLDRQQAGLLPGSLFQPTPSRLHGARLKPQKDGSVTVTVTMDSGDDHLIPYLLDVISRPRSEGTPGTDLPEQS